MGDILDFRKQAELRSPADDQEEVIKMTTVEAAKLNYAAKKLDVPMIHVVVVKHCWQANATAKDFGVAVSPDGDVSLYDEDLALIQKESRFDKKVATVFWTVAIAALILFWGWLI